MVLRRFLSGSEGLATKEYVVGSPVILGTSRPVN
ncbi:hypothetical protein BH18CHL2_BH18CHL2_05740 [soil metagenome]